MGSVGLFLQECRSFDGIQSAGKAILKHRIISATETGSVGVTRSQFMAAARACWAIRRICQRFRAWLGSGNHGGAERNSRLGPSTGSLGDFQFLFERFGPLVELMMVKQLPYKLSSRGSGLRTAVCGSDRSSDLDLI